MKGLALGGVCFIFLVACCAIALRVYRGEKEYTVFLGALLSSLVLYTILFGFLPSDLGFLPRSAVEPAAGVDFLNGALVLLLIFHGMWTFAYMALLGATMRLLLELSRKRRQGLTQDEAQSQFESGGLANVFLSRRLPKLINGGYIAKQEGGYHLSPRGRAAGRIVVRVKQAIGDLDRV